MDNLEMFEEFVRFCKKHTIQEIVKEWGGYRLQIPSYKSTYRDADLYARYLEGASVIELMREFDLSESRVRDIIAKEKRGRLF